jgi:hypothetical protein
MQVLCELAKKTDFPSLTIGEGYGRLFSPYFGEALVPFHVTQSSATFTPLFESRRAHGARSHGPESLKPLPGLAVS